MRDYDRFSIADGEYSTVPEEYAELCRHISDGGSGVGANDGEIPAGELADRIALLEEQISA
jgi:hypothetical protein